MQRKIPPISMLTISRLRVVLDSVVAGDPVDLNEDEVIALVAQALRGRGVKVPDAIHVARDVAHASGATAAGPVSAKVLAFPLNATKNIRVPVL